MAVSTTIPANWKLPLFWAVVDGSMAGNLTESQPALLTGQAFLNGAATSSAKNGMTGNGLLTLATPQPVLYGAIPGTYKVKFTNATTFSVTDPNSNIIGLGTLGNAFAGQIAFAVVAGSTPFVANDEFDVVVTAVPAGSAIPNVAIAVGSVALAKQLFGEGSMLERMVNRFLAGNTTQQLWCLPILDPTAAQAATGSIQFASTTALQSGVLSTYIAGQLVAIAVYATDTPATIVANLVAAINATTTLPVTAAIDGTNTSKIDLTCRWKGATGNDIDIRFNYLGLYGGQATPVGLTSVVSPMAGGAGSPDFTTAIGNIASKQFYHAGLPYNDTGSLTAWDAEYGFGPGGRWAFTRQQYGWVYNGQRLDYADAMNWGLVHNSSVITTLLFEPQVPSPIWECVAAYCAQGAAALLDDPARPLQTLPLIGILPAPEHYRFSQSELNSLTNTGFAVQSTGADGQPRIAREALQYQFNLYGQSDTAFALLTVLSNLAELLSRMKSAITSKYPRHKLAPDGTKFGPGQAIVTPINIKAELVSEARAAEYDGLMSNVAAFIANLIVEIDDNNSDRVNILWPPQLMGQLRDFDVLAQFRLQYPTATAN